MQIHQTAGVALHLPRVAEALGQRSAEDHVGRASAPLPSAGISGRSAGVLAHVASARIDGATAARLTDRVRDGRTPHRVQVRCFATTYS